MANDQDKSGKSGKDRRLTLHPLSLEQALKGAMETGKPPEPENKRAKRSAGSGG
jgi:hypothetical protein